MQQQQKQQKTTKPINLQQKQKDAFYDTQFGDQLKWLEKTLSDAQKVRKQRPWIFAFGHRPIYASEKSFVSCDHSRRHCFPQGQAVRVQNAFEQLFEKYNVDIVFNGYFF